MDDKQTRKLNMTNATLEVMDDNNALWSVIPAIVTKNGQVTTSRNEIVQLALEQGTDISGNTTDKDNKRKLMADAAYEIAKPLTTYAIDTNNEVLKGEIDFELTDFTTGKDIDARDNAQLVHDRANSNIGSLGDYNINAAMLTTLQDRINGFGAVIGRPRAARSEKKSKTEAIVDEFVLLEGFLEGLDNLMVTFRTSESEFFDSYKTAREVVDTGNRKVMLIVKVVEDDSGLELGGADVTVTGAGHTLTRFTTVNGLAQFKDMEQATYSGVVKKPGYVDKPTGNLPVDANETLRVEIRMVRV